MADFNSFKNKWLAEGKADFDHSFGYQCVDLVRYYFYENYGLGNEAGGVPYAISYWTDTPQGVLNKFDRIDGSNARQGDVVILRTAGRNDYTPPGHIGLATGNINDANVEILEQNGSTGGGSGIGPDAIRTRYVERSRVAGLLRPKNDNATTEQVQQAYRDLLAREADPGALDHYVGKMSNDAVRLDLWNSQERKDLLVRQETEKQAASQPIVVVPENYATHYTYSRLDVPLNLVTNKDAPKWDLNFDDYKDARAAAVYPKDTPFRAFGKAQRNDLGHEVYYMTEEDFNKAPQEAYGINTVDLKQPDTAVIEDLKQETEKPAEDNTVPVKVIPSDPNKWKESFNTFAAGTYRANKTVTIEDAELKLPKIELYDNQIVPIAGTFSMKDGQYYRTKTGVKNDTWYKIPLDAVTIEDYDEDTTDDDLQSASDSVQDMINRDKEREKANKKHPIKDWILAIMAFVKAQRAIKKQTKQK
jgi:hypothetical protein